MSALQRTRLGMSRRDIGAGLVGGVAALLANALFQLFWVVQLLVSNPAAVLTDPEILWSAVQWDTITVAALTITPVVALVAGTVVWRAGMPEEPTPRLGAVAGVGTAFLSLLGFALAFGVFSALSDLSRGALFEAVDVFLIITGIVLIFGSLLAGAIFAPLGAAVGYAYECWLARREDASLGS